MTYYSTQGRNLKRDIFRFCGKISSQFSLPARKFVFAMIFGLLASKSCHLTKIVRKLNEDIALDKTVERLSRNLMDFDGGEKLHEYYFQAVKKHFDDSTILIIDDSDISKPCSSKLEGLCRVHDGSTGEIADGYWVAGVSALTAGQKQGFGFEKFLVRSLKSIRNLDLLLSITIGYIGILSEKINESMEVLEIIQASKRLYSLSKFTFYAISDGLSEIFSKLYTGIRCFFEPPQRSNQLCLLGWL